MIRTARPPVTQEVPDLVTFEQDDLLDTTLCARCLASNQNANYGYRIDSRSRGLAKELFGTNIVLPSGQHIDWMPGRSVPCGPEIVAELALIFGTELHLADHTGAPLPLFAVSVVGGTAVCAIHAQTEIDRKPTR